jgi:hypothetical protein
MAPSVKRSTLQNGNKEEKSFFVYAVGESTGSFDLDSTQAAGGAGIARGKAGCGLNFVQRVLPPAGSTVVRPDFHPQGWIKPQSKYAL